MRRVLVLAVAALVLAWTPAKNAQYAAAWARVAACSGAPELPGHGLEDLTVITVPGLAIDGHPVLAEWIQGDTIRVLPGADTGWVMEHELLHARLQATHDHHPLTPFAFPCRLMLFQHAPGGIMGPRA